MVIIAEALDDLVTIATIRSLEQFLDIYCELNCVSGWTSTQVVLTCLQTALPRIEVHRCHLREVGLRHVEIQTLTLADVWGSSSSKVNECPL